MTGRAKFVHWLVSPFEDIPSEPMFELENGSTVGGGTLLTQYGINIPLFPDLKTWREKVDKKERCFRCWAAIKGPKDLVRHRYLVHGEVQRVCA